MYKGGIMIKIHVGGLKKYGLKSTTITWLATRFASGELEYNLQYAPFTCKPLNKKEYTYQKHARVFVLEEAIALSMSQVVRRSIHSEYQHLRNVKSQNNAFMDLSKMLKLVPSDYKGEAVLTMEQIDKESQKVFNQIYTTRDVINGNNIEMANNARQIAIKRLRNK